MASVSAILHHLFSDSERELCSTSNKRNTLGDQDNTFHTKAFSGRFSFLKQHTRRPKEHTTFHSRTLAFARSPIQFTCCPVPPKSGLMSFFATFSKLQFLFDVRFVRLFLHTDTLFCSFVHNFDTALSQIKIFTN